MGILARGNELTEFNTATGPAGRRLQGDGETGLKSHREANHSASERIGHPGGVAFEDTPAVKDSFERLKVAREKQRAIETEAQEKGEAAAEKARAEALHRSAASLAKGSAGIAAEAAKLQVARAEQDLDRAKAAAPEAKDPPPAEKPPAKAKTKTEGAS